AGAAGRVVGRGTGIGIRTGADRHVVGIEQPRAGLALGRRRVHFTLGVEAVVRRGFDPATVAADGPATRADAAVEIVDVVAPHHHGAAIARFRGIGIQFGVRRDIGRRRRLQPLAALPAAAHADAAAALRARGIDAAARHADVLVGQQLHAAAVHATGVDAAAADGVAAAADQAHHAAIGADAVGVDHARVVDQVGEQVLRGRGLQHHGAAVGLQAAVVRHRGLVVAQALLQRAGDLHVDQAVAVEIQHRLVGAVEVDAAVVRHDQAVVLDLAADQSHRTAAGGLDGAVVDDAGAA